MDMLYWSVKLYFGNLSIKPESNPCSLCIFGHCPVLSNKVQLFCPIMSENVSFVHKRQLVSKTLIQDQNIRSAYDLLIVKQKHEQLLSCDVVFSVLILSSSFQMAVYAESNHDEKKDKSIIEWADRCVE